MNREMVLYYTPENTPDVAKLKGVLVRMGVRIKNITPDQTGQTVGRLVGLERKEVPDPADTPGEEYAAASESTAASESGTASASGTGSGAASADLAEVITEQVLVMYNFSSRRIDELLLGMRRAGVPRIALKAVVTEENSRWTFRRLYAELKKEHEALDAKKD